MTASGGPVRQSATGEGREAAHGAVEGADDPATCLRRAADWISEAAADATPGPWDADPAPGGGWYIDPGPEAEDVGEVITGADADWITLLGPQVAAPLAVLLRAEAVAAAAWERAAAGVDGWPVPTGPLALAEALALADAILGEAAR